MPSPQASSYQREATPPGPSFPNDNGSGSTIQRKREDGFIMAVKRAFSLDYYAPVPTVDEDVEAQRRHRHNNMVSTRRWAVLVALIGPFILLVLWIAKEHTTRSRSPLAAPHDDVENRNPAWDGTACGNVDGNDPVQALKAASTRTGLTQAAVAADHPVCSDLGLRVLEMGGNAVDAAVGVALCLGVANPASSGLGGGGFLLIHADPVPHERPPQPDGVTNGNNNKKKMPLFHDARNNLTEIPPLVAASGKVTEVIDCREIAPAAAETLMYEGLDDLASVRGGLAIGVPGELRGLELAHARHGRLAWAAVVGEVHRLADAGVPVNANLAHEIMIMYRRYHRNAEFPALRQLLTKNGHWSTVLKEGDVLRNPALTRLLADVRDHGANALYTGTHAAHLAADIQAAGGIVTVEDIENYRATLRSPVYAHGIRGYSLVGVPPPSSGGAAIVGAARFLAGYDDPLVATADTKATHRLVEAEKHAFAMRMSLADPAFDEAGVVQDAVQDLTRGDYMEGLRQASSDDTILPMSQYGGAKWAQLNDGDGTEHAEDADEGDRRRRRRLNGRRFGNLQDNGTSHFSIVDRDGNAVSMTTSVNTYFGSNVISPSTGVLLSNTVRMNMHARLLTGMRPQGLAR